MVKFRWKPFRRFAWYSNDGTVPIWNNGTENRNFKPEIWTIS